MQKKIYSRISQFVINVVNTTISVLKICVASKRPSDLNGSDGGKCLVLGTGPSLKSSLKNHFEYLKKNNLLCVNTFSLTEEYLKLRPRYYLILDQGFWESHGDQKIDNTWQAIREQTTWQMYLYLPFSARNSAVVQSLGNHEYVKIVFFNYVVFKGFSKIAHFFYRNKRAAPQSGNVLVAATFMAVQLGFETIEIFGADHNWHEQLHVREDNVLCVRQVHFYEEEEEVKFIPFYKLAHVKEVFRVDEIFSSWGRVFHGYIQVREYAISLGAEIFNASEVSFIDAFERIKIEK